MKMIKPWKLFKDRQIKNTTDPIDSFVPAGNGTTWATTNTTSWATGIGSSGGTFRANGINATSITIGNDYIQADNNWMDYSSPPKTNPLSLKWGDVVNTPEGVGYVHIIDL